MMDPSQNTKNTDCYFYYYSTCSRENCPYRHEPLSRGCEIMCLQWKEGKCTNLHCNMRHMEIKKKRSEISCYWEKQPSGCLKAHCPFMHQSKDNPGHNAAPTATVNKEPEPAISTHEIPQWSVRANHESLPGAGPAPEAVRRLSQTGPESYSSPPVEPVIVTFEEESDSESAKSSTPTKVPSIKDNSAEKTFEEIRLAEIQEEQAAYWQNVVGGPIFWKEKPLTLTSATGTGTATVTAFNTGVVRLPKEPSGASGEGESDLNFRVLTLEEIRRNRSQARGQRDNVNESVQTSTPMRSCVLSRLGGKGRTRSRTGEDDCSLAVPVTMGHRRVSSTTGTESEKVEVRRTLKRVHSVNGEKTKPIKRVQLEGSDASSTVLDDTDEFIRQIDAYLLK